MIKAQLTDSKIEKVAVFLSETQVVRSAKIFVSSGKTEIKFNECIKKCGATYF